MWDTLNPRNSLREKDWVTKQLGGPDYSVFFSNTIMSWNFYMHNWLNKILVFTILHVHWCETLKPPFMLQWRRNGHKDTHIPHSNKCHMVIGDIFLYFSNKLNVCIWRALSFLYEPFPVCLSYSNNIYY